MESISVTSTCVSLPPLKSLVSLKWLPEIHNKTPGKVSGKIKRKKSKETHSSTVTETFHLIDCRYIQCLWHTGSKLGHRNRTINLHSFEFNFLGQFSGQ